MAPIATSNSARLLQARIMPIWVGNDSRECNPLLLSPAERCVSIVRGRGSRCLRQTPGSPSLTSTAMQPMFAGDDTIRWFARRSLALHVNLAATLCEEDAVPVL